MQHLLIRHATQILTYHGKKILVDPMLSDRGALAPIEGVPNPNGNPLVDLPVPVETLFAVDAILITHLHRDHFDDAAAQLLPKTLPVFCQPQDAEKLREKGFTSVTAVQDKTNWQGIAISRTGGRHGHGVLARKMAPVSGYVMMAAGEPSVYIAGDTVYCRAVRLALSAYLPQVVVCYCGAAQFKAGLPITMGARDVRRVCKRAPRAKIIAVHMEAWNHCRLTRAALRTFVSEHGLPVAVPNNGDLLTY